MPVVIMNPGAGPVEGKCTLDNAHKNMERLLKDAGFPEAKWCRDLDAEEEGGRFSFMVTCPPDEDHDTDWGCPVDMPGLPLRQVRWVDGKNQNIWNFPRLYVDGSSWVWKFAVSQLRSRLTPSLSNGEGTKP
jgi:hypothetical protein